MPNWQSSIKKDPKKKLKFSKLDENLYRIISSYKPKPVRKSFLLAEMLYGTTQIEESIQRLTDKGYLKVSETEDNAYEIA